MDTATKEADSLPQRPHRTQGHCVLCVFGGSRYLIAEAGEGNRRLGGRIGRDRSRRNTPLLIGKRPHAELEGHAPCRTGRTCSMQNGKDTLHAEREGHAPCRTGRTCSCASEPRQDESARRHRMVRLTGGTQFIASASHATATHCAPPAQRPHARPRTRSTRAALGAWRPNAMDPDGLERDVPAPSHLHRSETKSHNLSSL